MRTRHLHNRGSVTRKHATVGIPDSASEHGQQLLLAHGAVVVAAEEQMGVTNTGGCVSEERNRTCIAKRSQNSLSTNALHVTTTKSDKQQAKQRKRMTAVTP